MKKTITILLIALCFLAKAQSHPTISIWRVTPTVVCQGDTVKFDFKLIMPWQVGAGPNQYVADIIMYQPLTHLYNGSWNKLDSTAYETWPAIGNDSCHFIKLKIPNNSQTGLYSVNGTFAIAMLSSLKVISCLATGVQEYQINENEKPIYFDLYGNKIEPRKNELIIQQTGNRRKKIIIE